MTEATTASLRTWDTSHDDGCVWVRRVAGLYVAEFESGARVEIPTSCDFLLVSLIERGHAVVVAQRTDQDTTNAWIINETEVLHSFFVGDAVQDLVTLDDSTIAVSYFDEGFAKPISGEGIAVFDRAGEFLRGFASTTGVDIVDCYALVPVDADSVAAWHYSDWDLTIWNVRTGEAKNLRPPESARGASAITNSGNDWWFYSPHGEPGAVLHWEVGTPSASSVGRADGSQRGRIGGEFQAHGSDSTHLQFFTVEADAPKNFESAEALADATVSALKQAKIRHDRGLSEAEIRLAEERVGAAFPEDLRLVLGEALPVGERFPTWRDLKSDVLRDQLEWPVDGLLFDVEQNDLWHPRWPERPDDPDVARKIAQRQLRSVPKLIPIAGHRYLPAAPHQFGNPVLSVYQADIIYYGRNLVDYLDNEFLRDRWRVFGPTTPLPFWNHFL